MSGSLKVRRGHCRQRRDEGQKLEMFKQASDDSTYGKYVKQSNS